MSSNSTLVPPKVLAKVLEKLLTEKGQTDGLLKMVQSDRKSFKFPITGIKTPRKGPVTYDYLKKNKIHLFHYTEGIRRITIAYQYDKGTGNQSYKRFVKYGATIHRDDAKNGKHEAYDKNGHTWTAINRLMNQGIKCEISFNTIFQFKQDLRKFLVTHGCYDKNAEKSSFHLVTDHITELSLMAENQSTVPINTKIFDL
jgi:hypothetical protein